MRCRFSPAARQDLLDISDYIAADNPQAVAKFIDGMETRCRAIADMPESCPPRPELGTAFDAASLVTI